MLCEGHWDGGGLLVQESGWVGVGLMIAVEVVVVVVLLVQESG